MRMRVTSSIWLRHTMPTPRTMLDSARMRQAMRFWGKIFCTKGQYYVVEASVNDPGSLIELPAGKPI